MLAVDQSDLLHALKPLVAQHIPAAEIGRLVLVRPLGRRLDREMRRRMAQEQEPRFITGLPLANELDGVLVEHIGCVELARRRCDLLAASLGQSDIVIGVILIVRMVARVAVEFIEAASDRPGLLVHVPLAHVVATVPRGLQHFGQRHAPLGQSPEIPRPAIRTRPCGRKVPDARLRRIQSGHQRRAAGTAPRGVVQLREPHAAAGQGVDVRRTDLSAVAAQIRVPQIIGKNDQYIRLGFLGNVAAQGNG